MQIVSLTLYVPYEGVPHAGGEYYLRHLQALLRAGHAVTLVAPDYPENRDAMRRCSLNVCILLVSGTGAKALGAVDRFNRSIRVSLPQERYMRNVCADPRVRSAVMAADLLEYQWTQSAALHDRMPADWRRGTPSVAVAHDVLVEKYGREVDVAGLSAASRLRRRLKLAIIRRDERRMLSSMDAILTFSEKDVCSLHALLGSRIQIESINPPLALGSIDSAPARQAEQATILMVGAFYRQENAEGADWFLTHVWPSVRASVPKARLELVGQAPSPRMLEAARADPAVHVSGYVDDLHPYYRRATVAVVPLHSGAGVKFKSITAMLWGVPIITTAIGAEGVVPPGHEHDYFLAVEEAPEGFSAAIVEALQRSGTAEKVARRAREFAEVRFGIEGFEKRLSAIYSSVHERRDR